MSQPLDSGSAPCSPHSAIGISCRVIRPARRQWPTAHPRPDHPAPGTGCKPTAPGSILGHKGTRIVPRQAEGQPSGRWSQTKSHSPARFPRPAGTPSASQSSRRYRWPVAHPQPQSAPAVRAGSTSLADEISGSMMSTRGSTPCLRACRQAATRARTLPSPGT